MNKIITPFSLREVALEDGEVVRGRVGEGFAPSAYAHMTDYEVNRQFCVCVICGKTKLNSQFETKDAVRTADDKAIEFRVCVDCASDLKYAQRRDTARFVEMCPICGCARSMMALVDAEGTHFWWTESWHNHPVKWGAQLTKGLNKEGGWDNVKKENWRRLCEKLV